MIVATRTGVGWGIRRECPQEEGAGGALPKLSLRVHAVAPSKTADQVAQWEQPGVFMGVLNSEIQTRSVCDNWCPEGDVPREV